MINKSLLRTIITSLLGISFGIAITRTPLLVQEITAKRLQHQSVIVVDKIEEKKQSLENFFRELTEAESKQDWEKLYSTVNPKDKKWFSIDDMTTIYKGKKVTSSEYVVHSIDISGDSGFIDRTMISCFLEKCEGKDREEQRRIIEFVHLDSSWYQQSKKEPSEKARQLAAYMYTNSGTKVKNELIGRYGGDVDDYRKIIRLWSIVLENDPELMAYDEAIVEKHKAENSRSNVYVDSPDVIQQPVAQQPSFNNRLDCTSNTIGNYTYTNCY